MCKFDLYVCGSIYICTVRLIFVQVRFICMRFNSFLYGSIDICVSSIYMYAVRFIFVQFDLYKRVLKILSVTEHHRDRRLAKIASPYLKGYVYMYAIRPIKQDLWARIRGITRVCGVYSPEPRLYFRTSNFVYSRISGICNSTVSVVVFRSPVSFLCCLRLMVGGYKNREVSTNSIAKFLSGFILVQGAIIEFINMLESKT